MKRVIVCMKPVPDPKEWHRLRIDPASKTLAREGIPCTINPLDRHAIEAALQIKDSLGAEVILVSMAPPFVMPQLREALAMGADRAILLSDRAFAGSDTLATARVLAAAIKRTGAFDCIFCGNFTLDGSTAQVPSQLAELLGIPCVMHVTHMELQGEAALLITQGIEHGFVRLEAEPPLLLAFTREANRPRYICFGEILQAEKRDITIWNQEVLRLDEGTIGLDGSPTRMADLLWRQKKRQGIRLEGSPEEVARLLADRLYQLGLL